MAETQRVQIILWHPDNGQVALQDGDLPTLEVNLPADLTKTVREAWGMETWIIHDGGLNMGQTGSPRLQAVLDKLPEGWEWAKWDVPPLPHAQAWQLPGWPAQAKALLHAAGFTGKIKQVSNFDLNTVLQIETSDGPIFLKVNASALEMRVTTHLAQTQPELVPPLLAVSEANHWQITANGGELLDSVGEFSAWTQALERLARFQTSVDASALANLGCPAYPLEEIREQVNALLSDTAVLQSWGLEADRIGKLQGACPTIQQAFNELKALNLPHLPAHGDAHPRNVLHGERGSVCVWFDWSETGCAAHPFMDIGWFLCFVLHPSREKLAIRQAHPDLETRLAQAYLTALGSPDATKQLAQAIPLAMLHRAAVYDSHFRHWEGTLPGWRPNYVPFYLRQAARELSRLSV